MIIAKGAEAIISRKGNKIIKSRIKKSYRLPELDKKLRKQRTKREARLLNKASSIIPVPQIIKTNLDAHELEIQFIPGKVLSESLDSLKNSKQIVKQIGTSLAKLHDSNMVHGDLTTSNLILSEIDGKVYFVDFGLGFDSYKAEDKAVDLHLIKHALEAKHHKKADLYFSSILEGYKSSIKHKETLSRLKKVELRGRNKNQY